MSWTKRDGVDWPFPDRDRLNDGIFARHFRSKLAGEPLGDVLGRGVDLIEWGNVVDAAVVELLGQRFELAPGADEIDGDGVGVDASRARGEIGFDFVRVPVQRLGDAAILAKKVGGFEAGR